MVADEPGGAICDRRSRGGCRHQHLERQLRQRAGRHDQQLLALDEVLDLTEQRLVEPMRAGVIEGQRLAGIASASGSFGRSAPRSAGPPMPSASSPQRSACTSRVSAAVPKLGAHPAHVGLGHDPDEGFLGRGLPFRRVEEQHQRLVGAELGLHLLRRERRRAGERGVIRELRRQPLVDLGDARIDGGKPA